MTLNMHPAGYTAPFVLAQRIMDTFGLTTIFLWLFGITVGLVVFSLLYKFLHHK